MDSSIESSKNHSIELHHAAERAAAEYKKAKDEKEKGTTELTGFVEVVRERTRALAEFPALALSTIREKCGPR